MLVGCCGLLSALEWVSLSPINKPIVTKVALWWDQTKNRTNWPNTEWSRFIRINFLLIGRFQKANMTVHLCRFIRTWTPPGKDESLNCNYNHKFYDLVKISSSIATSLLLFFLSNDLIVVKFGHGSIEIGSIRNFEHIFIFGSTAKGKWSKHCTSSHLDFERISKTMFVSMWY